MKSKYKIACLIFMALTLISVVTVSAVDPVFYPELKFKNYGKIWYFSTLHAVSGDKLFSGHDVYITKAYYKYYPDGIKDPVSVVPKKIKLTDEEVRLYFDKSVLPPSWEEVPDATDGDIIVEFTVVGNTNTHIATGPGYWLRRRP